VSIGDFDYSRPPRRGNFRGFIKRIAKGKALIVIAALASSIAAIFSAIAAHSVADMEVATHTPILGFGCTFSEKPLGIQVLYEHASGLAKERAVYPERFPHNDAFGKPNYLVCSISNRGMIPLRDVVMTFQQIFTTEEKFPPHRFVVDGFSTNPCSIGVGASETFGVGDMSRLAEWLIPSPDATAIIPGDTKPSKIVISLDPAVSNSPLFLPPLLQ